MNTVIFSIYDSGYRSSALLLSDDLDWDMIDQTMYKEQIPNADDIADYSDEELFAFFSKMFNAEIKRVVTVIDGEVYKVRCRGVKINKEKQIKEIQNIICNSCGQIDGCKISCRAHKELAENLYRAGYRRVENDQKVISK